LTFDLIKQIRFEHGIVLNRLLGEIRGV